MKRVIAIGLILAAVLLAGCSKDMKGDSIHFGDKEVIHAEG